MKYPSFDLDFNAPMKLHEDTVRREWMDEYDHMNLAYYVMICDQATYAFWELVNDGRNFPERNGLEYAVVETHVNYIEEVRLNDPVFVATQLLDYDSKRFHIYHELRHSEKGFLSATNEIMALGFNLKSRNIAPFEQSVARILKDIFRAQKQLAKPTNAGRSIGIRRSA